MFSALHFFQTDPVIGLMVAFAIFLITIFLVAKQAIQFSTALLFLVFAVLIGMIITNQKAIHHYFDPRFEWQNPITVDPRTDFSQHLAGSVENLEKEVSLEKESLKQAMDQIKEIFSLIDSQKQKLEAFIAETKDEFSRLQAEEKHESPKKEPESPDPGPSAELLQYDPGI